MAHGHSHAHAPTGFSVPRWLHATFLLLAALTLAALVATWPTSELPSAPAAYEQVPARISRSQASPCGVNECVTVLAQVPSGAEISLGQVSARSPLGRLSPGTAVVLGFEDSTNSYVYLDLDRRPQLLLLTGLFCLAVLLFARLRGLRSLLALSVSATLLFFYTAPALISGSSPVLVSLITAATVILVSTTLTHGFSAPSQVASIAMLLALISTWALTALVLPIFSFTGALSEDVYLVRSLLPGIDLPGLVFGSILIGFVGALDDVVLTQVAAVSELTGTAPRRAVFAAAMRIGRTHVSASVNTLTMAYLSASMPLLLFFALSSASPGLLLSGEVLAVEVVRMFIGTLGLMVSVPLATALATFATQSRVGIEPAN